MNGKHVSVTFHHNKGNGHVRRSSLFLAVYCVRSPQHCQRITFNLLCVYVFFSGNVIQKAPKKKKNYVFIFLYRGKNANSQSNNHTIQRRVSTESHRREEVISPRSFSSFPYKPCRYQTLGNCRAKTKTQRKNRRWETKVVL